MRRQAEAGRSKAGLRLAAVLLAPLLLLAGLYRHTWAEEPRDAIRRLPNLSHTSFFETNSTQDSQGRRGYTDKYVGSWDVDWRPRPLSPRANITLSPALHYHLELFDQLGRLDHTSSDGRTDDFNFTLRLDAPPLLEADSYWHRNERVNGGSPAQGPPSVYTTDERGFHVALTQPGLPTFNVSGVGSSNYFPALGGSNGSDYDKLRYQVDFGRDFAAGSMHATAAAESWRSRSFVDQSESSADHTNVDSSSRLNLGAMGSLYMGYNYDELSQISGASATPSTNTSSRLVLGLDGAAQGTPLGYSYNYTNTTNSSETGPLSSSNDRAERRLSLSLNPPVPAGKSASMSFSDYFADSRDPDRRNTTQVQELRWQFAPNKRTNSNFYYSQTRETDELTRLRTREADNLQAGLNYAIPGNRGSLGGSMTLGSERRPGEGRVVSSSGIVLSNQLVLGPRAGLNFQYSQSYNDQNNPLFKLSATDYSSAEIRYILNSGQGLSLNAGWRQDLSRLYPDSSRGSSQSVDVTLNYRTTNNWNYTFRLQSKDAQDQRREYLNYSTSDLLQATVSYSF